MTDTTSNDKAFIKVSEEVRRLENSLVVMEAIKKAQSRMDQYSRGGLRDLNTDKAFTEEIDAWLKVLPYFSDDGTKIEAKIEASKKRLDELRLLQEVYLKGGNILASKLARD